MGNDELSLSAQQPLSYFRHQLDRLQAEPNKRDASPNVVNELFIAREELKTYVKEQREGGHNS